MGKTILFFRILTSDLRVVRAPTARNSRTLFDILFSPQTRIQFRSIFQLIVRVFLTRSYFFTWTSHLPILRDPVRLMVEKDLYVESEKLWNSTETSVFWHLGQIDPKFVSNSSEQIFVHSSPSLCRFFLEFLLLKSRSLNANTHLFDPYTLCTLASSSISCTLCTHFSLLSLYFCTSFISIRDKNTEPHKTSRQKWHFLDENSTDFNE